MLTDLYIADNDVTKKDINRIESLLLSPVFLEAIGSNASNTNSPKNIPIVTNIIEAHKMMASQEIWDTPEPWPYQYFVGEVEDEAARMEYKNGFSKEDQVKIGGLISNPMDTFGKRLFELLDNIYNKKDVYSFLKTQPSLKNQTAEEKEFIICNCFKNEIEAYIFHLITAAYFGGIDSSPFFKRLFECFETGGMPCGWLGGVTYQNGADPTECMALLHFGS